MTGRVGLFYGANCLCQVSTNQFFEQGEQRAAKVQDLFAQIARRYDLLNDLQSFGLHRYWKRRLVRLAQVTAGERALDVCCGTGDIALAMARKGADVTGLDFSQPMLDIAMERAKAASPVTRHSPHFVRGDAERLPFSDGEFQIVTVGYGLRNLSSWEAGLREMQRVAASAGRLLVLDFGKPKSVLWRSIYFSYLRWFVPLLGRTFCGNAEAYAYILESLKHYPAQDGVAAKMQEMGLKNVRVLNLLGGVMSINYGEKA
jgi:demethylmenaquinone methyltransferase/2-methoxy-6-polyprenyl-1,4-benzoquinol methylase